MLRTIRLGEADRIVTFITRGHGKVRAVAKGVRKTTSKFGGRLEPMSHLSMLMWQGRELDIVNQAEVIDAFRMIRQELSRVAKAYTLLEVCDQLAQEGHPDPRLYDMLVGALKVLESSDAALLVPAFLLKALLLEGSAPHLESCVSCGAGGDLVAFDPVEGGALCRSCRRGRPLHSATLELMRRILGGDLASVLDEAQSESSDDLLDLTTEAMEAHLDRRLRTLRTGAGS